MANIITNTVALGDFNTATTGLPSDIDQPGNFHVFIDDDAGAGTNTYQLTDRGIRVNDGGILTGADGVLVTPRLVVNSDIEGGGDPSGTGRLDLDNFLVVLTPDGSSTINEAGDGSNFHGRLNTISNSIIRIIPHESIIAPTAATYRMFINNGNVAPINLNNTVIDSSAWNAITTATFPLSLNIGGADIINSNLAGLTFPNQADIRVPAGIILNAVDFGTLNVFTITRNPSINNVNLWQSFAGSNFLGWTPTDQIIIQGATNSEGPTNIWLVEGQFPSTSTFIPVIKQNFQRDAARQGSIATYQLWIPTSETTDASWRFTSDFFGDAPIRKINSNPIALTRTTPPTEVLNSNPIAYSESLTGRLGYLLEVNRRFRLVASTDTPVATNIALPDTEAYSVNQWSYTDNLPFERAIVRSTDIASGDLIVADIRDAITAVPDDLTSGTTQAEAMATTFLVNDLDRLYLASKARWDTDGVQAPWISVGDSTATALVSSVAAGELTFNQGVVFTTDINNEVVVTPTSIAVDQSTSMVVTETATFNTLVVPAGSNVVMPAGLPIQIGVTSQTVSFDGANIPTTIIDTPRALNTVIVLPEGQYTIRQADVSGLTLTGDGLGPVVISLFGTTGLPTLLNGAVIANSVNVTGGDPVDAADQQLISLWLVDGTDVTRLTTTFAQGDDTVDLIFDTAVVPTGSTVRVVWTQPGFDPYIEDIVTINGSVDVSIARVPTANAATGTLTAGAQLLTAFDDATDIITYRVGGLTAQLSASQTNLLMETAKATLQFSQATAKLNSTALFTHSTGISTQLLEGTFRVAKVDLTGLQQEITNLQIVDALGALTPRIDNSLVDLLASGVISVIIFSEGTLGLADLIGVIDVQTGELRVVIDEELKEGVLTNIGRP